MEPQRTKMIDALLQLWAKEEVIEVALAAAVVAGGAIFLILEAFGAPR